ncbi:hypothetical protein P175DRAFT_0284359 [Aspergillus ochraceoroseus IBT 24754]|uniref:Uncharacterized protein n=1 Tax=Aspergillus ochraceoroseus IBT 24754 TaxID=1392256 RepID=A0A2T5LVW5_9EURO|nr:uncharacterized protein P175DRAFT_0284359 [Aspergillus ochraceoroseus IBT 24754]PTU20430.1 hypothetical protein P175DRAFT_0284359 [Aspergillus ochraceoroseus IBT 24754]
MPTTFLLDFSRAGADTRGGAFWPVCKSLCRPLQARVLMEQFQKMDGNEEECIKAPRFQALKGNLEKYLDTSPMRFSEWVERHKKEFPALFWRVLLIPCAP